MNSYFLYINSFLHYCKSEEVDIDDSVYKIHTYFLDKRFVCIKDENHIEAILKGTKVKDFDEYYYKINSAAPLNNHNVFHLLLQNSILYNIGEFEELL